MKKIFILGASALQVPAIRKAKEKGLYVYALDYDPEAVGIPEADEFLCISTIDKEAVLEAAKKYEPDYIITSTSDMPVRTVAWVNEQLGKRNDISYEDAICATDKAAMRRRMKECGVPVPEFHVVSDEKEFLEAAANFPGRFVSKPADNAASRGVVLVDRNDLRRFADDHWNSCEQESLQKVFDENEELLKIYEYTKEYSRSGEVLLEEFMEGPEVSVESITVDGSIHIITITDKMVTEVPYFVETGHTEPSRLSTEVCEDIRNVAIAAIKALNIQNGPNHTEIKVTPTGAKLVEIAARLGGDFITSKLVPLSTGVDMTDCCISGTLGEEVRWQSTMQQGSAIRFLSGVNVTGGRDAAVSAESHPEGCKIQSIDGADEAAKMPGVTEVVIYKKPGDTAGDLKSSGDRWGHVIATGADADEAAQNAERAAAAISFKVM